METPKGTYTIAEAAGLWIEMIQAPETKGTPEQKTVLVAQINAAVPIAKIIGVGGAFSPMEKIDFASACNNIKRTMREGM